MSFPTFPRNGGLGLLTFLIESKWWKLPLQDCDLRRSKENLQYGTCAP